MGKKQKKTKSLQTQTQSFKSELDWSPKSWLGLRVVKPDGTKYTKQDERILASHVPEYLKIEKEAKKSGTWLKMPDGSKWKGDPRSWVMMQSQAFKKNYRQQPWYTGQAEWSTTFDYPNDKKGAIKTNKLTRAPYYDGQMWFSNSKEYGDAFAYYYASSGIGSRARRNNEKNIWGNNFLSAIPKQGKYRSLASPNSGTIDQWESMPYRLKNGHIYRLARPNIKTEDWFCYFDKVNSRKDGKKVLTDDVANWSKNLGDSGIFLHKVSDGRGIQIISPDIMKKYNQGILVKKINLNLLILYWKNLYLNLVLLKRLNSQKEIMEILILRIHINIHTMKQIILYYMQKMEAL